MGLGATSALSEWAIGDRNLEHVLMHLRPSKWSMTRVCLAKSCFPGMTFCAHDSCDGPSGNTFPGLTRWDLAPLSHSTQLKTLTVSGLHDINQVCQ